MHHLAEQLEHVGDEALTDRLEEYLGFPAVDPLGDPIPDRGGKVSKNLSINLSDAEKNKAYRVVSFADTADSFLDHLSKMEIEPGAKLKITDKLEYDGSLSITINKKWCRYPKK